MRKVFVGIIALAVVGVACASSDNTGSGDSSTPEPSAAVATTAADCVAANPDLLFEADTLTIATDNPVFQPWFGGTGTYGDWKAVPSKGTGNPASGEGYEGAFAFAVAEEMGLSTDQVTWVPVDFNLSYKPGPLDYDFYLGQVAYTPERAQAVTFSDAYYGLNQALVANKGTPIAAATSIADLKSYKLGAQTGTTSYQYIADVIQPDQDPAVFDRSVDVIQALNNEQIDGYLVDAPTAYVNVLIGQASNGVVVGQFPDSGEYLGVTMEMGNPFVDCVNLAIAALDEDGTLESLRQQWLEDVVFPTLK